MKDRIVLEEPQVVPFLEASYTLEQALADLDKKVRGGRSTPSRARTACCICCTTDVAGVR